MVKKSDSSPKLQLLLIEVLYYSKFSLKFIFACYFRLAIFHFRIINTTFKINIPVQEWAYTQDQVFC